MLTAGCAKGTEKEQSAGTTSGKALAEMNDIPADGIITKEQFQSVAGKVHSWIIFIQSHYILFLL